MSGEVTLTAFTNSRRSFTSSLMHSTTGATNSCQKLALFRTLPITSGVHLAGGSVPLATTTPLVNGVNRTSASEALYIRLPGRLTISTSVHSDPNFHSLRSLHDVR